MANKQPFVSIIVPVFNAEKTLPVCLGALESQTYSAIELIFVNDCSQDNSLTLIEEFCSDVSHRIRVQVYSHVMNKGVAAARNTGLNLVTGDFIYYVDADDRLEPDAISVMVDTALATKADIVGCNWFLSFVGGERKMKQPYFADPWDAISKILPGTMRWNLWLFLVKRTLYEDYAIRFIDGMNMGEDLLIMVRLFSVAQHVAYVDRGLYHYEKSNEESLTRLYSAQHMEQVTFHVDEVERSLKTSRFAGRVGKLIDLLKFHIKLPFLISDKNSSYRTWLSWFPEINTTSWSKRELPARLRLLRWAALNKQFWILKFHYYLLTRVIYGVIYK